MKKNDGIPWLVLKICASCGIEASNKISKHKTVNKYFQTVGT